jgi:hypothetical protein
MWSLVEDLLEQLRALRGVLLTLAILFFIVMLIEVDLGHYAALSRGHAWLALIPVVWLPVSLIALMAVQAAPSTITSLIAIAVMAVSAAVGMLGSGLHMMAAGVDFDHLNRIFSSSVWGGHQSPNWPVAITVASVLGLVAAVDAGRHPHTLPHGALGVVTSAAFILIVLGCALAAVPGLVTVSAASLAVAALLLLAVLLGRLATAMTERTAP